MSSNRRPYLTATALDQALLDEMADNLDFGLELTVDVETTSGTIYASDRNKYVGSIYYSSRCTFPTIKRTLGEWLSPSIEFSTLEIPISNVDGLYNDILPGGLDFSGWIGKQVDVKLGLRDQISTFKSIYQGKVTDIGGLSRDRQSLSVRTRDKFDLLNVSFPKTALNQTAYPDLESKLIGTILPVIYGDFETVILNEPAEIPAFVVNGAKANVIAGIDNIEVVISESSNSSFDSTSVYLQRGDVVEVIPAVDIVNVAIDNNAFEIQQGFLFDGAAYVYDNNDKVLVRVKGKALGGYNDNIVWQARDILITHGGAVSGDFAASWATFRDKTTPAQSAIANIKSRVWIQEPEGAINYALSLLEQVRLESAIDRDLKLKINSLHFENFIATPATVVKQWDVKYGEFSPKIDDRNIWNRARASYAYSPLQKENSRQTSIYKNQDAIDQIGKAISKSIEFPNLYVESDVIYQLIEMIRLASAYPEFIDMTASPRLMLLDVGDFVSLRLNIGSLVFEDVPAMVREIGFDKNLNIILRLWSMQMTLFPGWTPSHSSTIVGGYNATIDIDS